MPCPPSPFAEELSPFSVAPQSLVTKRKSEGDRRYDAHPSNTKGLLHPQETRG